MEDLRLFCFSNCSHSLGKFISSPSKVLMGGGLSFVLVQAPLCVQLGACLGQRRRSVRGCRVGASICRASVHGVCAAGLGTCKLQRTALGRVCCELPQAPLCGHKGHRTKDTELCGHRASFGGTQKAACFGFCLSPLKPPGWSSGCQAGDSFSTRCLFSAEPRAAVFLGRVPQIKS